MNQDVLQLALIAVAVILPLLPAVVLYRFLPPGQMSVNGPFKGWQVKLTGASAAYFVVFAALAYALYGKVIAQYELWTLEGQVEATSGDGIVLTISPPRQEILYSGTLATFKIAQVPLPIHQTELIPHLVVHKTGGKQPALPPETVPLGFTDFGGKRYTVVRDATQRRLVIRETIKLGVPLTAKPYPIGPAVVPATFPDNHP